MHHFIFPTADTWISSGSSTITGESFKDQNFGRDQILEVKKFYYNNKANYFIKDIATDDTTGELFQNIN